MSADYICIIIGGQLSKGLVYSINKFNPTYVCCLSHSRILTSNIMYSFLFNCLRWEVRGERWLFVLLIVMESLFNISFHKDIIKHKDVHKRNEWQSWLGQDWPFIHSLSKTWNQRYIITYLLVKKIGVIKYSKKQRKTKL